MTDDLNEAIESARTVGLRDGVGPRKHHSRGMVISIVRHVLGEIADGQTVRDVLDDLQTERRDALG